VGRASCPSRPSIGGTAVPLHPVRARITAEATVEHHSSSGWCLLFPANEPVEYTSSYRDYRITTNVSIMMNSQTNAGPDPLWQYKELPPADLIKSLGLETASIDEQEFYRAEWFWRRRPKAFMGSVSFFLVYLAVLAFLCYLAPDTIWLILPWILVGAGCASIDCMRLDRWRAEYASSIKRVVTRV
jgi:hypothetical protein